MSIDSPLKGKLDVILRQATSSRFSEIQTQRGQGFSLKLRIWDSEMFAYDLKLALRLTTIYLNNLDPKLSEQQVPSQPELNAQGLVKLLKRSKTPANRRFLHRRGFALRYIEAQEALAVRLSSYAHCPGDAVTILGVMVRVKSCYGGLQAPVLWKAALRRRQVDADEQLLKNDRLVLDGCANWRGRIYSIGDSAAGS
ncbi:hypothetical protein CPB83DRAFT_840446 [Crepidotus variabilis]|uniref:Uncharacterized protein n=1 Tax=Crepidotus variabilis TaxID=179855 RepID=A0A9P6JIY1_9AGAR|nr:hypothetical protein CPB83DRAFT_840446 [Crepidotus variabilis]